MSLDNGTGHPPIPTAADAEICDDTRPLTAAVGYRAWGWPVTLHCGQIRLNLDGDAVALIIPVPLATQATAILTRRHCPAPVLTHPYAPEQHILLAGERYGMTLPWPPGVHQVSTTLLLPPTVTPRSPITWLQPPEPNALRLSREIDIFAALRTALHAPPAPH